MKPLRIPGWWPINWWPFCKHEHWQFTRNVYGDEARLSTGRSWFECKDCGLDRMRPYLAGIYYPDKKKPPVYNELFQCSQYQDGDGWSENEYIGNTALK
jgi:hypothetical protein